MAATRKLQGEIDRCLKKVAEGVETFEDIWKKVHNATNSNQKVIKEKYEADLKKEIKKLQRLRDQIKSWIASAEIKDKSALLENRRLIETQMERFKIVERETKTKAYSKEGLGAAQKMDPAQRIKDEARNWLTSSISSLQIQIDQYESEIESLLAGKKKRLDRDKQDRMDELRSKLDRHKFHVTKLETLLRLLDNDGVEAEQVNKIKDDVEYYIESSQEPDFEENEFIYDDIIGLDEVELSGTATTDSNNSNETGGSPSSITSGGSPVQSPPPPQPSQPASHQPQQQNANNLNYSSDSTSVDITAADKRNKNDNSSKTKVSSSTLQPVKPTAVRANNNKPASATNTTSVSSASASATATADANLNHSATSNNLNNSTSSLTGMQLTTTAAAVAAAHQSNKIISSTPSKNHHQQQQLLTTASVVTAAAVVAAAAASNHTNNIANNLTSSGAPVGSSVIAASAATAATAHGVNATVQNSNLQQQQHQTSVTHAQQHHSTNAPSLNSANVNATTTQSVIQPTIAFAAVAKNNTSHLENGPVHPATSYAMAAPTVASIVGSNAQQQQQQLLNLQTNSSHQLSDSSTTHNHTSTTANSIANNSGTIVPQQIAAAPIANNVAQNINNKNNSLSNCISPNGMGLANAISGGVVAGSAGSGVTNNSTRVVSPGLLSPKHMNGLPVSVSNNNNNAVDTMSTLKTMALEAVNRSVIDSSVTTQAPNVDTRKQQEALLQQQQQQQSQHFSPAVTDTTANNSSVTNGPTSAGGPVGFVVVGSLPSGIMGQQQQQQNSNSGKPTTEAHIPPLLGVAPLGPSPLHKDHQMQFQMMEAAYYHLPTPSDSEKLTTYFHRNPVQTPLHYPQSQLPIYDTVEFYQRLSTETLFFVFYYMEGSKAQYLAAKALKKQSWRFHTKYMMWFQRHEEPKIINDDYEQGTYIYFDYEKWSQRKKEGFTFEYKYLEDKELN